MRTLILAALLLPFATCAQTTVNVQNPSFEAAVTLTTTNANGSYEIGTVPNWTGSWGVWQPAASEYASIPDGVQVIFGVGTGNLTQDLGVLQAGTYNLTIQQGNRGDGTASGAACTVTLGTATVTTNNSTITAGTWKAVMLAYTSTSTTGDLILTLAQSGGQCNFDKVAVTFTPATSPPILDTITVSLQVMVCASACDGTDDTPETGNLIVAQQKLTQSFGFNSDGTISAQFGIDTSVDPADFTIWLSDAPGALEYKIPQSVLANETTIGKLALPPMRIQKTANGIVFKGFITP